LNRFFGSGNVGAHYIMEGDGHLIKLCREGREVVHAGVGRWSGRVWNQGARRNSFSIGPEIINPNQEGANAYPAYAARANPPYTNEQYGALEILTSQLLDAHPHIGIRLVGHADVATGPPRAGTPAACYSVKRFMDPGTHFAWERLEDAAKTPVRIPRPRGIEDSSRNWSAAMVLEHLVIVNLGIAAVISALCSGDDDEELAVVRIEEVKPSEDAGLEQIERLKKAAEIYAGTLRREGSLRTQARHPHPWFGPLDARRWHALAAVHMGLHRRQIERIVQRLG
jgi:hypothetical protein